MAGENKVCPECGADMAKLDPVGHSLYHWPEYMNPAVTGKQAFQRQKQTMAGGVTKAQYDAERKEET